VAGERRQDGQRKVPDLSNREIGEVLHISEVTVKSHIGHIFTKLGLRDRAAAIVYAFDNGIVAPQA
jgi:DNA-binding NarL/FixJ family response regulator